ncbi:Uncharacterised protein [Vibrio cholerae]|nr:Uncharacterised protein [Vibrio cholerae]
MYEQIRLELRNKSVTAYLLHHGFIKAATERGIECDKEILHTRIITNFISQLITIHFRHFSIRNHHE